jgi:hypothetical protein
MINNKKQTEHEHKTNNINKTPALAIAVGMHRRDNRVYGTVHNGQCAMCNVRMCNVIANDK